MNEMKDILLPGEPDEVSPDLPPDKELLFAPVDKRAFGAAIGSVAALGVAATTAAQIILRLQPALDLSLLGQYFVGYDVTWKGAFIGALWGFAVGFCGGWCTAFIRNLVLAVSLFMLRSRAELNSSRDFLDHI